MTRTGSCLTATLCLALAGSSPAASSEQAATAPAKPAAAAPASSQELRPQLLLAYKKAADFLRSQRKEDGAFDVHPGVTALAATALLREPGVPREKQLETVGRALDQLAALARPDGSIHDQFVPVYVTAVSMTAFVAGGRPQDQPLVAKGRQYLASQILDEGEGVAANDKFYGGLGYGAATPRADGRRADMVSLEYGLRALKDAGTPRSDAAWDKALKFLERAQNASETNDQTWAADDGGFVYYPGFTYHQDGGTRSYGSVSYAGLLSYTYADVKKTDSRVQAALKWIRDNYTVDENPGTGQKTVYYYYMVFAKALSAVGEPVIVDSRGQRHNWREELGRKLLSLQHPEGYWVNEVKDEWQDNKVLVTSFTLAAIESILKP
jgi:hypothetical protein